LTLNKVLIRVHDAFMVAHCRLSIRLSSLLIGRPFWMQIRTRVRNGYGEENLIGNRRQSFLILLRTQLILERDAIDAKCLLVECWTETFLSRMLRRWEMASVARRIGPCFPSSTGFRSQNVNTAAGYDAFLTYLNAGLAAAFIELCAAASDVCTDCCYCDTCLVSMR